MLEVLRTVLLAAAKFAAGVVGALVGVGVVVLKVGTVGVDCVCFVFGVGSPEAVTERVCGLAGVTAGVPADVAGRVVSSVSCRSPF